MIDITMVDELYIVKCRENWWQLRMTFNKECISTATSLDGIVTRLDDILKRYSCPEALRDAWRNTELRRMSEAEKGRQEKTYKEHGADFKEHVENSVKRLNGKSFSTQFKTKVKKKIKCNVNIPKVEAEPIVQVNKPKAILPKKKKKKLLKL